MVVFDPERPVRREAPFQARANTRAPSRIGYVDEIDVVECGPVAVVGDRSTALDVEQDVVGGITDAAGEQAECVNRRTN